MQVEYNRESIGESIKKQVAKVESCTFSITTLTIIAAHVLKAIYIHFYVTLLYKATVLLKYPRLATPSPHVGT
jgi:hypothetical protein